MDFHSRYNHRWHSQKVEAYNSPIHGLGVTTNEKIRKGEIVFIYGGVIIPKEEIGEYWKSFGHVGIQIEDGFWICPTSREELEKQGVINHSCNPNSGFSNQVTLVAIEDIEPGQEVTFDYAFTESFMEPFACNCATPACRKQITQEDWGLAAIREKYHEYYSPYLKSK